MEGMMIKRIEVWGVANSGDEKLYLVSQKDIDAHNDALDKAEVYCGWNNSDVIEKSMTGPQGHHFKCLVFKEPIKQETCADVLREMVEMMESGDEPGVNSDWFKSAKAALERES